MSFTDQKQRIATPEEVARKWGTKGGRLRCYLCASHILPGDKWRWIYGGVWGACNIIVCGDCDGESETVIAVWKGRVAEFNSPKYWALREQP